jgi:hypothetical protein
MAANLSENDALSTALLGHQKAPGGRWHAPCTTTGMMRNPVNLGEVARRTRTCRECKAPFVDFSGRRRFCSERCKREMWERTSGSRWAQIHRKLRPGKYNGR